MKNRKTPLRKCIGCGELKDKGQLIRVVRNKEGEVSLDTTGKAHGRGAYICSKKECLEKAIQNRGLNRSFKCEVPKAVYNKLLEEIPTDES